MQVWSNQQAIEEYQDLLSGKAMEDRADVPSVIIGQGRVGELMKAGGSGEDVMLGRGGMIPPEVDGNRDFPIYVCVPNDEVENIIRSCPVEKLDDLVFMQSGMLEPVLKKYALCGNDNTQLNPIFWQYDVGSRPQQALTDMGPDSFGVTKYAGETTVCGKWSGAVVQRLKRHNLDCKRLYYRDWRRTMIEKTIFDSVFNLIGVLHDGQTLGEVGLYYRGEVEDMLYEINQGLRGHMAVTLLFGVEERLFAHAQHQNVEWRPAKMENFKWRNGFLYAISKQCFENDFPDPMRMHTQYLEYAKEKGFCDFDLEPYSPYT